MFNVSKDYAPPFGMIAPFFKMGSFFYIMGIIFLFFIKSDFSHNDLNLLALVHWYLLGFVMMIIFGAMAQLIPVVMEVGHFSIDLYRLIWPFLTIGTFLMGIGFLVSPKILPYGGLLVIVSMSIFLYDTIMTLRHVEHISLTVKTVAISSLFLSLGIFSGFMMALGIGEGLGIDMDKWLDIHVVFVLGGYVTLTIMGLSIILLPMFGLSHGFDETPIKRAFWLMVAGVSGYSITRFLGTVQWGELLSLLVIFISVWFYLYQIMIIYRSRARKENDIWAKSMYFGYGSLASALILGMINILVHSEQLLLAAGWFVIMGFFTFLITGHLYKIIPFLVWFERFSPLVGKEKVPMLHEMYPKKVAQYEFVFSSLGVVIGGLGLLLGNDTLFKVGISLMVVGGGCMFYSVKWMMNYK